MPYADPKRNAACKRAWQKANRRKISDGELKAYHRNPTQHRARVKRYRDALGAEELRRRKRKNRGLPTPLRAEPSQCENCGRHASTLKRGLHLDHCHITGEFRGWLCHNCNTGIGKLGDSIEGLERAIFYLAKATLLR